ncbi:MAG: hypothetical protein WBX27_09180 [Specibacter sp.]
MIVSTEPFGLLAPGGPFTLAELSAMRLDGVLAPVFADTFRPVNEPETAALRAAALVYQVPPGLAGRAALGWLSAAWVYGCAPPPPTITLLIGRDHRSTVLPSFSGCVLHEVLLDPFDVEQLGGAFVTGALRTAVDVALHVQAKQAVPVLLDIAATPGLNCPLGRVRGALAASSHLPGKFRALELLEYLTG